MSSPVVLITGGSRGIGAATARIAAAQGFRVAINYRTRADESNVLVEELTRAGHAALAIQADVGVEADVVRMFEDVTHALGPITGLVNNAGILEQQMRLDAMTPERWTRVFTTNVIGTFLCAREAVRRMSRRPGAASGGSIVNVSSRASIVGGANEYIDYASSKGAVDTLTVGLAREVAADGIRVNAVRPGAIRTDIHASGGEPARVDRIASSIPLQRGGEPHEVAEAIVWLLSDRASYVTGAILDVGGGR